MRSNFALPLAIVLCGLTTVAVAAKSMSPEEIKATFGTGVAFASTSPAGARYSLVLKADGTATRTPRKSKAATPGTWRLSKDGYCSKWSGGSENCYTVEPDGTKYTVLDAHGKTAAVWSK
jgi:hypothetical protein